MLERLGIHMALSGPDFDEPLVRGKKEVLVGLGVGARIMMFIFYMA